MFTFVSSISMLRVGSQVFQAWRKFMDEIEQQSKQIRSNAEHLENLCSDRMHQLCQEKKKSRKQYQEEHARIASQFAHVSNREHLVTFRIPRSMHQQVPRIRIPSSSILFIPEHEVDVRADTLENDDAAVFDDHRFAFASTHVP